MLFSKTDAIIKLSNEGYDETLILRKIEDLVKYMHSVRIGKHIIDCIYNGNKEWKYRGSNSSDLEDYLYTIT